MSSDVRLGSGAAENLDKNCKIIDEYEIKRSIYNWSGITT